MPGVFCILHARLTFEVDFINGMNSVNHSALAA